MHIFIDESGTFVGDPGRSSVSLVGALAIPDGKLDEILHRYAAIRRALPKQKGQVKGRLLSERHVNQVATMLARNEVIFCSTAIDLGAHDDADVRAHMASQRRGLIGNLSENHHPDLHREVALFQERLDRTAPQLYIQGTAMTELIAQSLEHCMNYFAQRRPSELANFHWTVDQKQIAGLSDWEDYFQDLLMPMLQSRFLRKPIGTLRFGDYSAMDRYWRELPPYLQPADREPGQEPSEGWDLRPVVAEDFRYSAAAEPGLELADIVTNATRRALSGNLKYSGWAAIPRMMIHVTGQYIQFIHLGQKNPSTFAYPYQEVLREFRRGGKVMIAPRFINASPEIFDRRERPSALRVINTK